MVVVFDNNAVISASILPGSVPFRALVKARTEHILLASFSTIFELNKTIVKPKFDKYMTNELRTNFVKVYINSLLILEPNVVITSCRDPKDNKFLELSLSGNANCIVSGDKDLLILNPFRGIPIFTASEFLTL